MPTSNAFVLALKRRWWIVLLVIAGAITSSVVLTARERLMFRASTTHVVIPNTNVESPAEVMRTIETLERRSIIATFAKIPMSPAMRAEAAKEMAVADSAVSGYRVSSGVVPNTNLIKVDVEGPDARVAADFANALATVSWREARSLYRIFSLRSLVEATPPTSPFYPDPERNHTVAAILGLLLGVFAAFATDRVLSPESA